MTAPIDPVLTRTSSASVDAYATRIPAEVRMHNANSSASDFVDAGSVDALFAAVYDRLKAMAGKRLSAHEHGGTLDTTSLVHELYLRVSARGDLRFAHPAQFFTYAAR